MPRIPDTTTRAGYARFLNILALRKLRARWSNTQAAKVRCVRARVAEKRRAA